MQKDRNRADFQEEDPIKKAQKRISKLDKKLYFIIYASGIFVAATSCYFANFITSGSSLAFIEGAALLTTAALFYKITSNFQEKEIAKINDKLTKKTVVRQEGLEIEDMVKAAEEGRKVTFINPISAQNAFATTNNQTTKTSTRK